MTPKTRLRMSLAIVVISTIFGLLVLLERDISEGIALWYVPTVLTMILLSNIWKRNV